MARVVPIAARIRSRRRSCDASVRRPMTDGPDGEPMNVGRRRGVPCRRRSSARSGRAMAGAPSRLRAHALRRCASREALVAGWRQASRTRCFVLRIIVSCARVATRFAGTRATAGISRRPDGRAIPVHGYQPEDMIDEAYTSAEGVCTGHMPIATMACARCAGGGTNSRRFG